MDTGVVAIIAAAFVVVVVVVLLRKRITGAKASVSLKDRKASAEFTAGTPAARAPARNALVGNVARWWSRIRVPEGAHVRDNEAAFGSSIEMTTPEKPDATSGREDRGAR